METPLIVIIEDDPVIGRLLGEYAETAGFQSEYFQDFDSVSKKSLLQAKVVILDLKLPDFDGLDILEEFSKLKLNAAIVLCSGLDQSIIMSATEIVDDYGLLLGGVLQKPFDYGKFLKRITTIKFSLPSVNVNQVPQMEQVELSKYDVKVAIRRSWFYPVFQPQIDLETGYVTGLEVLARLYHPLFGFYGPGGFINTLAKSGLMDHFTLTFVSSAIEQVYSNKIDENIKLSFNLDSKSLNRDFIKKLEDTFSDFNVNPERITLEITEMSALDITTEMKKLLTKLRIHGFSLSLDDFGTGYSTITDLSELPFNELKIDKRFVQSMEARKASMAIVKSTLNLSEELSLAVVAEGVETESQLQVLKKLGCQVIQGFYMCKPEKIDIIADYIANPSSVLKK